MIALKKEAFEKFKKELVYLLIAFVIVTVVLQITFYKEDMSNMIRMSISIFWIFVLPGYSIMFYWHDKLEFVERLVLGIFLAAGAIGISSYYIGLIGLDIKYHLILLPSVLILMGAAINLQK